MTEIKINLKQLVTLFMKSAADDGLTPPVRALAARMIVLTAHVERVEAKIDAQTAQNEKLFGEMADIMMATHSANAAAPVAAAAPATTTDPAPAPTAPSEGGENDQQTDEDPEEIEARMIAEAEAEVAAMNARASDPATAEKPTAVTPLRRTSGKKSGGAA